MDVKGLTYAEVREIIEDMGYTAIRTLGKGSFGQVLQVKPTSSFAMLDGSNSTDSPDYAMKWSLYEYNTDDPQAMTRYKAMMNDYEFEALKIMTESGMCSYAGICLKDQLIFGADIDYGKSVEYNIYVTDMVEGLTMGEYIGVKKDDINQYFSIVLSAAQNLQIIHDLGIVHRDIKTDNMLVDNDVVRYIDFGLCCVEGLSDKFCTHRYGMRVGTPYYMAPEVRNGSYINSFEDLKKTDVWSLGVIFYLLSANYNHTAALDLFYRKVNDQVDAGKTRTPYPNTFGACVIDPKARPNLETVIQNIIKEKMRFENA